MCSKTPNHSLSVDLQSPSFFVHTPLMSFFFPSTTTVLVTSKKSYTLQFVRTETQVRVDIVAWSSINGQRTSYIEKHCIELHCSNTTSPSLSPERSDPSCLP